MLSAAASDDSRGLIELYEDMVMLIAQYLDFMSLYCFSVTSHENMKVMDPIWKNRILFHFPDTVVSLNEKIPTYRNFFTLAFKTQYSHLSKQRIRLLALISNNDFDSLKSEKINYDDFYALLDVIKNADAQLKHYLYDNVEGRKIWDCEWITVGLDLNLSEGSFRKMVVANKDKLLQRDDVLLPLYHAASKNSLASAAMLLKLGIEKSSTENSLPLFIAAQKNHLQMVKLLVENGAHFNANSTNPLSRAAYFGNVEVVDYLYQQGADINVRCVGGLSPLFMAMQQGKLSVVNYLLAKGADVNIKSVNGCTPLYVAAKNGHADCVIRILKAAPHLINIAQHDGSTPLCEASRLGHDKVCEILLKAGAEIKKYDLFGFSPLRNAVLSGKVQAVDVLLRYHADVNYLTNHAYTALYIAAIHGPLPIVRLLLKNGANVNLGHIGNISPLYMAARNGHYRSVELLLRSGACIDMQRHHDGATALHGAIINSFKITTKVLLQYGANVNFELHNGKMALHLACEKNNLDLIILLLQYGAYPLAETHDGRKPAAYLPVSANKNAILLSCIEKLTGQVIVPRLTCQPNISFDINLAVDILREELREVKLGLFSLLGTIESDFGRMVVLYANLLLEKNKLCKERIVYALGYDEMESAKEALYHAILAYFSHDESLFKILQEWVISPLVIYAVNTETNQDKLDAILLALAFFEGQVRNALPKEEYNIKQQQVVEELPEEEQSLQEVESAVFSVLNHYQENYAVKKLKFSLHDILEESITDSAKILAIKQNLVNVYYNIRMAAWDGDSKNMFIKPNLFADDLEKLLEQTLNYAVPHVIPKNTDIPIVKDIIPSCEKSIGFHV